MVLFSLRTSGFQHFNSSNAKYRLNFQHHRKFMLKRKTHCILGEAVQTLVDWNAYLLQFFNNRRSLTEIPYYLKVCMQAKEKFSELYTAFNKFSVISWQGAKCSLLRCYLTELSCTRHLKWYSTRSHNPDTGSPYKPYPMEFRAPSEQHL